MDFVLGPTAEGRVINCLTIFDGTMHEAGAVEVEQTISGWAISGLQDRLVSQRGLPRVIRMDSDREFWGKEMAARAHQREISRRLIERRRPNQYGYVKSFNGRLGDEFLNSRWFPSLLHARTIIESWRRDYSKERCRKALGGTTSSEDGAQLAAKISSKDGS